VVPSLEEGDATTRFHQSNCWDQLQLGHSRRMRSNLSEMPRINVLLPATADNPDFQARLGVESHVGQGSTFAFTLPVVVERQVEPA
jgi:hypothetical protein